MAKKHTPQIIDANYAPPAVKEQMRSQPNREAFRASARDAFLFYSVIFAAIPVLSML